MPICEENTLADYERQVKAADAATALPAVLAHVSTRHALSIGDYPIGSAHVAFARDNQGDDVVYGLGKGSHARIGAVGECIEHLYLNLSARGIESASRAVERASIFQADPLLQFGLGLGTDATIEALPFRRWGGAEEILLPTCLANHDYFTFHPSPLTAEERFFANYATSSGTAFGLSTEDALLHGALELLERDTTSKFFLAMMRLHPHDSFLKVRLESLPKSSTGALHALQGRDRTTGVDVTYGATVCGAHWFLTRCSIEGDKEGFPVWGAGCSINPELALYRSISECLQMIDATSSEETSLRLREFVAVFPGLLPIFEFNDLPLNLRTEAFGELTSAPANATLNVRDQLEYLDECLGASGRQLFFTPLAESNFSVVTAFIPHMERFFNITHCTPVLPLSALRMALSRSRR